MSLALLYPAALAALLALAVPVLLHLARRPQQRTLDFAALRWIAARIARDGDWCCANACCWRCACCCLPCWRWHWRCRCWCRGLPRGTGCSSSPVRTLRRPAACLPTPTWAGAGWHPAFPRWTTRCPRKRPRPACCANSTRCCRHRPG
ncbi:hypothetical protein FU658_09680 [Alkalisalibacterium limincola]|uniref:Aerotolerance regulator N-terminal domain-containing protein n=1 Tax=Alkalisalibacterium limincola TaxID=2699169 RepID=A0A5C8KRN4_9GAMM|nr:hypothetical protein FU658_09680 [Alkalisalibacterium limincola]